MPIYKYDQEIIKRISGMERIKIDIFLLSCNTHMFFIYERIAKERNIAIDDAWSLLDKNSLQYKKSLKDKIQVEIDRLPGEDDSDWSIFSALSEDFLSSLFYAIEFSLSADENFALWSSRRVYDASDLIDSTIDKRQRDLELIDGKLYGGKLSVAEINEQINLLKEIAESEISSDSVISYRNRARQFGVEFLRMAIDGGLL